MTNTAKYRHYGMSTPREECIADFVARYGVEPVVCEVVISPTLLGGKKWGYWKVGPVPEKNEPKEAQDGTSNNKTT